MQWAISLMAGVVPWDLKRIFVVVRATSSRGPVRARLCLDDRLSWEKMEMPTGLTASRGSRSSCQATGGRRCTLH